jgi:predicted ATPase
LRPRTSGRSRRSSRTCLGIPAGARYPPLDHLGPQRKKEQTLQALVDQLAGLTARQPVLALWEDAHWIDPTSLELLGLVVDRVQRLPVLAVITFRPEFRPPWTGHGHVTALSLGRLSRRQGGAMIERMTAGKPLPEEVVEQIIAKTDGVPLFVEELTRTVLESGLLTDVGDRDELAGGLPPSAPLAIPATLRDSLMARLDRLARGKEVAQIAAVMGREFSHELLAAVADRPEPRLSSALDQLVAAGLIFRRGLPPEATYSFKHALIQEAAYHSLLRSRRRELHRRIADVLETSRGAVGEDQPELLAHHFTEAGLYETAVDYWTKAGQNAFERFATAEAVAHLSRGLGLIERLPENDDRDRRELHLLVSLGPPLMASRGITAREVGEVYARAHALCDRLCETRYLATVLQGLRVFHGTRGELYGFREIRGRWPRGSSRVNGCVPAHR